MRFLIEFDGVVADVIPVCFSAHLQAAAEVGWSRLDETTFRRRTRAKGREANILPGARPAKVKQYYTRFDELVETDEHLSRLRLPDGLGDILRRLTRHGECTMISLGANITLRGDALERAGVATPLSQVVPINVDPRRRPGELTGLAGGDRRTFVVAASDSLVRAGGSASLLTVAVASGMCSVRRLEQAGADLVYREFGDLAESLDTGAQDLLRIGLLPESPT